MREKWNKPGLAKQAWKTPPSSAFGCLGNPHNVVICPVSESIRLYLTNKKMKFSKESNFLNLQLTDFLDHKRKWFPFHQHTIPNQ